MCVSVFNCVYEHVLIQMCKHVSVCVLICSSRYDHMNMRVCVMKIFHCVMKKKCVHMQLCTSLTVPVYVCVFGCVCKPSTLSRHCNHSSAFFRAREKSRCNTPLSVSVFLFKLKPPRPPLLLWKGQMHVCVGVCEYVHTCTVQRASCSYRYTHTQKGDFPVNTGMGIPHDPTADIKRNWDSLRSKWGHCIFFSGALKFKLPIYLSWENNLTTRTSSCSGAFYHFT